VASRRKAREALLKALYMSESRGITVDAAFREMAEIDGVIERGETDPDESSPAPFSLGLDEEQKEFALALARVIERKKKSFSENIGAVLENWDLRRVSRIDRFIMWIALAEMTFMVDIPPRVSMNEAIELAKKYSSGKSSAFINGVLDAAARRMGFVE